MVGRAISVSNSECGSDIADNISPIGSGCQAEVVEVGIGDLITYRKSGCTRTYAKTVEEKEKGGGFGADPCALEGCLMKEPMCFIYRKDHG